MAMLEIWTQTEFRARLQKSLADVNLMWHLTSLAALPVLKAVLSKGKPLPQRDGAPL
jgi:hypothetical protein